MSILDKLFEERYPNFKPLEVVSPLIYHKYPHLIDLNGLDKLQKFRKDCDFPFLINHGELKYRGFCVYHDRWAVPGRAEESMHYRCAFDVSPGKGGPNVLEFYKLAYDSGLWGGLGLYNSFVHMDTRWVVDKPTVWNESTLWKGRE